MAQTFNKPEALQTSALNSIEAKPLLGANLENLIPHNPVSPAKELAVENIHPENAYSFMVKFTTKDGNGDVFDEPHTVDGPTGSFNNPLNLKVINGNIHGPVVVVPLNSKSSTGAYFLKFHLPQPTSSVMFVTFCEKSNKVKDGYYDYINGIPDKYRSEFKGWIFDKKSKAVALDGKTYTKDLVFKVKGVDTNIASASVEFTISFVTKASTQPVSISPVSPVSPSAPNSSTPLVSKSPISSIFQMK